ncbi:BnaC01g43650D [Brassica napus]|uniref:BnaC01g43650D protein n=1 Tax=Brassica napus TaxID=3708 RepID=A0A078JD26_BRANA|nr:BnaC01g43650D [Brassica napus]
MSSGGGGSSSAASRQRNKTSSKAAAAMVEETFSLVPRESTSAFGMIIRLAPDLVEEIKRVEAQGGRSMRFITIPLGMLIIIVGGKEFKFTWSRERGDLCDIYEEHQSGEDGEGLLIESGCAWRKLNVQRTLDESTTSHMKMRSVEAIANFQAPRYFLKPGTDSKSYKKHSPDSITGSNKENFSVCERNGEVSQDCLPAHLVEQLNAQESVDILHHSPGILHEEKLSGNRDGQARSSSDSDSESDNSDSGNDSGSSSDSEASSNKESSDEEVDIMSDGDKEPQQSIQSAERFAIDLPGHGSDVAAVEGNDSDAADFEGHDSDPVDIDGHSSDEDHCSEADRKKFSDDNWKMEARTGITPTTNEEVGISGQEQLPSSDDNLRERQNFIGQLFDYTDNTTNDSLTNDQRDISERLGKDHDQIAPALDHYSQQSARVKNMKSQQLPAAGRDSQPSERKCDAEYLKAFATQMIDPLKGLQQSSIQKLNGPGQMKPVDSSGRPNTRSDNFRESNEGGHFPHETIFSRSGKAFRDNHRDDVHSKNKFPMNKKDDDNSIRKILLGTVTVYVTQALQKTWVLTRTNEGVKHLSQQSQLLHMPAAMVYKIYPNKLLKIQKDLKSGLCSHMGTTLHV